MVHHKTMLELHQKVSPKDTVVGWFATGLGVSGSDALIQEFYSSPQSGCKTRAPVHVVVDTTLSVNDRLTIKSFVSRKLVLKDVSLASEFVEIPTTVMTAAAESLGLDVLRNEKLESVPSDADNFRSSFAKLQSMIADAHVYVQSVVDGTRPADPAIGRCAPVNGPSLSHLFYLCDYHYLYVTTHV